MMNIQEIKTILSEVEGISAYEIRETKTESRQLFYVLKDLETNRAVETTDTVVTLYKDFDGFRGSSSFALIAADNAETLKAKAAATLKKAEAARNPYYPLAEKSENLTRRLDSACDMTELAVKAADAIFAADVIEKSSLNATEIFVNKTGTHFLNSNGVEHSFEKLSLFFESIPSCSWQGEEYELYFSHATTDLDVSAFTKLMAEELHNVLYRAAAVTPQEAGIPSDLPVYVKGGMLMRLVGNFANDLSYRSRYYKSNHYEIGQEISPVPFDLILKGEEKGANNSSPVDASGLPLGETTVIKDGKAVASWGDLRFGTYLKEEKITGSYPVMVLKSEACISEEDRQRPYLEVMNFSSPQLDESSGYFGGEVRLALYHDAEKVVPLTGFSISGNIYEAIKTVRFSPEEEVVSGERGLSLKGPKYAVFRDIRIS